MFGLLKPPISCSNIKRLFCDTCAAVLVSECFLTSPKNTSRNLNLETTSLSSTADAKTTVCSSAGSYGIISQNCQNNWVLVWHPIMLAILANYSQLKPSQRGWQKHQIYSYHLLQVCRKNRWICGFHGWEREGRPGTRIQRSGTWPQYNQNKKPETNLCWWFQYVLRALKIWSIGIIIPGQDTIIIILLYRSGLLENRTPLIFGGKNWTVVSMTKWS